MPREVPQVVSKQRSAHGKGSVYFDAKGGYWVAQLTDGFKDNGKPKYVRVKRKTEKDAVNELNAMLAKKATGRLIVTSDLTVRAWLETWLEDYVKPDARPKTYDSYAGIVRRWINPVIGKIVLKDLKAIDIDRLMAKARRGELSTPKIGPDGKEVRVPLSPDSQRLIRATLRRALNVAVRKDRIGENPVLRTDPPKMRHHDVVHLSTEEVVKLLEKCKDSPFGNLVILALHSGMRIGEALGLTWSNVDLEGGNIRLTQQLQRNGGQFELVPLKTGRTANRNLGLPFPALEALRDQKSKAMIDAVTANELNLVFTSPTGQPLHARTVDEALKALCSRAGIQPVSFHKLRHTVATRMAEAGVALDVIKDQLGHSQISLTANTYRHFVPAKQREASETLAGLYADAANRRVA